MVDGLVARGSSALSSGDALRQAYGELRAEVGPKVTVVVATKYVPLDSMQALVEAGIEVVGENRAQDLEAKHERFGRVSAGTSSATCSRARPRSSRPSASSSTRSTRSSAARRLEVPALVEVNLSDEEAKSGVRPGELATFLAQVSDVGVEVHGLMTMPPLTDDPERSRPYFRELALLAGEHGLAQLSMGTTQDYRVAVEEGATFIRVGSGLFQR